MDRTTVQLRCPKCRSPLKASLKRKMKKFFIFVCPECKSNIVYFKRKLGILSDQMLKKLAKKRGISCCGDLWVENRPRRDRVISEEDIMDLKILLGTSKDVKDIISRI